jgi:hypothetical protein
VDDVGGKRNMTFRNIVIEACSSQGIALVGASLASGGYLGSGATPAGPITPTMYSLQSDLIDYDLDGFSISGTSLNYGVFCSAGKASIRNGTITGFQNAIRVTSECTFYTIENVRAVASTSIGVVLSSAVVPGHGDSTQLLCSGERYDSPCPRHFHKLRR